MIDRKKRNSVYVIDFTVNYIARHRDLSVSFN